MICLKDLELRLGDGDWTESWSCVESVQLVQGAYEWSIIRIHQEDTFEVQELPSELVRRARVNCWISPKWCLWEDNWLIWSEEVVHVSRQHSEIGRGYRSSASYEYLIWESQMIEGKLIKLPETMPFGRQVSEIVVKGCLSRACD